MSRRRHYHFHQPFLGLVLAISFLSNATARAVDLDEARALAVSGQYEEALAQATEAIEDRAYGETWQLLKVDMELMLGRYEEAKATITTALERYSWSVRLRQRLREAARFTGDEELAEQQTAEIAKLVESSPWRYTDADNLITLGWLSLELGADAKDAQEAFFRRARLNNPLRPEPRVALGRLALDKRDFGLAADIFREAAESFPDDADIQIGLAEAVIDADPEAAQAAIEHALAINPHHIPSLLFRCDRFIEAEDYDQAEFALNQVLIVNPKHPAALAFWSALAHLRSDPESEVALREEALSTWNTNPEVDYIIGRELSQKYRFAEGAEHQRQALEFDPEYLPASKQLAQDLLRLGREGEGWRLAEAVSEADQYDVAMYNLVTLRNELAKFTTIEANRFLIRMSAEEAAAYGPLVVDLLGRARETICEKYGLKLDKEITVEIFPKPDDFAVRTFGMPGVAGYLGVCFGDVITANSPAGQLNPSNWESVLWHEFTHVVTLNLTRNKMPRWLSEGISVYEERQANPAWGEQMNPTYRVLILQGELTPIGELSSAFMNPPTPVHVQFAYYESSLVVEYLIEQFGFESLLAILNDLGEGVYINDAIERHAAPLEQLETAFAEFATERANALAPDAEWTPPELGSLINDDNAEFLLTQWAEEHPDSLPGLTQCAQLLIQFESWERAKQVLTRLIELYPKSTGLENPYVLLAGVHRHLGETDEELDVLSRYAEIDPDAATTYLRLIELETERENWPAVRENALRLLAVNPLIPQPHRALAVAATHTGHPEEAITAYRCLLGTHPEDPAELNYQLALLLREQGDADSARRHVLLALESAPRFRAAHRLLLELVRAADEPVDSPDQSN